MLACPAKCRLWAVPPLILQRWQRRCRAQTRCLWLLQRQLLRDDGADVLGNQPLHALQITATASLVTVAAGSTPTGICRRPLSKEASSLLMLLLDSWISGMKSYLTLLSFVQSMDKGCTVRVC